MDRLPTGSQKERWTGKGAGPSSSPLPLRRSPPVDGPPSPASTPRRSPLAGDHPGGLPSPVSSPNQATGRSVRPAPPCRHATGGVSAPPIPLRRTAPSSPASQDRPSTSGNRPARRRHAHSAFLPSGTLLAADPCRRLHAVEQSPASQDGPPPHLRRLPHVRHAAGTPSDSNGTLTVPCIPSGTPLLPPPLRRPFLSGASSGDRLAAELVRATTSGGFLPCPATCKPTNMNGEQGGLRFKEEKD